MGSVQKDENARKGCGIAPPTWRRLRQRWSVEDIIQLNSQLVKPGFATLFALERAVANGWSKAVVRLLTDVTPDSLQTWIMAHSRLTGMSPSGAVTVLTHWASLGVAVLDPSEVAYVAGAIPANGGGLAEAVEAHLAGTLRLTDVGSLAQHFGLSVPLAVGAAIGGVDLRLVAELLDRRAADGLIADSDSAIEIIEAALGIVR